MKKPDLKLVKIFYRDLYGIRRVEEEIARIYVTDKIKSPIHLSIGQEAVSVGVCGALRPNDKVFGTYRSHAMYLAKGGDLKKMMAELYGKAGGCANGKGGSMHLIDVPSGIMGTSAIVGTTIPIAVGYAYGLKLKKSDTIVASFFGDGATDEGIFHESMDFAALKRLPVLFVCENNLYAIHSHCLKRHLSDNICERARTYGMPVDRVEDGNIFRMYELADRFIRDIRKGKGPAFLECVTSRWKEHVGPDDDFHLGYRSEEEVRWWKENDQLKRLRQLLKASVAEEIEAGMEKEIKEAFEFAEESPFPVADELYKDVFKE